MFETIKKELYFRKMKLLLNQGVNDKKIVPFDEDFYKQMSHTFFNGIPISIHIKYLKPILPPGKCYERSLFMFWCFSNAVLVRGDNKDLELRYGKDDAGHGWIEMDDYVYDPSLMMRFDKDLYYSIYMPTNVTKCTTQEYCADSEVKQYYDDVTTTTVEDLRPNGRKRTELLVSIPLVRGIAEMSGDQNFISELNQHLSLIQYDEQQIENELYSKMKSYFKN